MDGEPAIASHNPIRHSASTHSGGKFEYEPGGGRYVRAIGATAQIQAPEKSRVRATNEIQSPLHSLDDVESTTPMPNEEIKAPDDIETQSRLAVKNEIPLNHPRQDESRLLKHLLINYDKRVRPILDAKKNITIYVGITLTQIFDMVSFLMVLLLYIILIITFYNHSPMKQRISK